MTDLNKRILVIDDDQEIWKAYKMVLEPETTPGDSARAEMDLLLRSDQAEENKDDCFQVAYAGQGKEGFAMAKAALVESAPFALAFIDVRMPPGWDGMETTARIRQLDPDVEIVIVTAYSDRSCEEIVRAVGSPDKILFIRKPFDPEELKQLAVSLTEKWNIARREEAQCLELQEKIVALKQLQQEQQALQKKLHQAQKMEAIGLMAGGVAHDLNNILTSLVGYPELMLMKLPPDSDLRENLETIQTAGLRASAVVADLLTVARGVALVREPADLNELVVEYLESPEGNQMRSLHPKIGFSLHLTKSKAIIACSQIHIKKSLMNLLTNAAESIKGPGRVTISTKVVPAETGEEESSSVVLTIADTGQGIAAKDLERIFEPFYSKKELGRSGTGLGLAVVWNCVKNHGGTIDVQSSGEGTTFTLTFPTSNRTPVKKQEPISLQKLKGNGMVLVVDDEEQQRGMALSFLEMLGYSAKAVAGGEEAVAYLKNHSVDLVLLDMIMTPGIGGRQTYEQIIKIHPQQKALMISGFSESQEVQQTMALGAGGFIRKPYTMEQFGKAIRKVLGE